MANYTAEGGDFLRLRYEVLKQIATISGVGIAVGLGIIEKFTFVQPMLVSAGVFLFAVSMTFSMVALLRLGLADKYNRRLTLISGGALLLGVYIILVGAAIGCYWQFEEEAPPQPLPAQQPAGIPPAVQPQPIVRPAQPQLPIQQRTRPRWRRWLQ